MQDKKLTSANQKAYQRDDREDRSLAYKTWLRGVETGGFFVDIDLIKCKNENGEITPKAITEITRCDSETVGKAYLDAIIHRWFVRDKQADIIVALGKLLKVPVYLVVYQKDMLWLEVFSFQKKEWKHFTPESWSKFLQDM